jgi:hypothetical protein
MFIINLAGYWVDSEQLEFCLEMGDYDVYVIVQNGYCLPPFTGPMFSEVN